MGFFDGIKKFANEMVDDEICQLGENAQKRELKNRIAKQLKQRRISNASTKKSSTKRSIIYVKYSMLTIEIYYSL